MGAPPPPAGIDVDRLRQLTERAAEVAAKAREAGDELNRIAVSATSRNRFATVTVGSGGILRNAQAGPAAANASPAQVCAAIMEAYGTAARQAAAEASELMQRITGRDTQVMQRMRAAMPPDPDEASP